MLQFAFGLVLVGLVLAYGLRWVWRKPVRRLDPNGKAFVVSGAASGFGKEVTQILAAQGGYVFAVDINEDLLLSEWKGKPNVHPLRHPTTLPSPRLLSLCCAGNLPYSVLFYIIRGDVTDSKSIEALVQEVKESGRGVFGLFNNAGIAHPNVSVVDCPEELMVRTMDINCFGIYRMTKAFFPLLKAENEKLKVAGEGTCAIVNMTSMAGLVAVPLASPYCISKHAAEALTAVLRRELRPFGIRVSAIEPSFARTPLLAATKQRLDSSEECWETLGAAQRTILEECQTLLDPVDIANAVVDALLSVPAPAHTIVAFKWESFVGKYLIHVLPNKVLDFVLTDGVLAKAKKAVAKLAAQKKDN